ncbi:MAG: DUF1287 domain-containing protein [Candidatus Krumholzibacteriota bacterium]|nr:DUF1287 domain-containing protein [Candidatus Krumholzibacteriota bacterium]
MIIIVATGVFAQNPDSTLTGRLVEAAIERTRHGVTYDGAYRAIAYPGGDVPDSIGVCTDLIIRTYRAVGIDLQEMVHVDMTGAFDEYPDFWGSGSPDPNIDHRRVPNLQVFFRRHGEVLGISTDPGDYSAGDIVTWMLPGGLPHIGIVTYERSPDEKRPLIAHNIGRGPEIADMLFDYPVTGHFRYIR